MRAANRILERGIAYHPRDWRNRFYLGFNHFFYLEDERGGARRLEPAVGASRARRLSLGRLAARLRAEPTGSRPRRRCSEEMVRNAHDPYERAEYEKALDEIETERRARVLDGARARSASATGATSRASRSSPGDPTPVLRALPPELHGWEWTLDAEPVGSCRPTTGVATSRCIHSGGRQERERVARKRARARRSRRSG